MNKLKTAIIGLTLVGASLFVAGPAHAGPNCQELGRIVYSNEPEYSKALDPDKDGAICETGTKTIPVNGSPVSEGGVNPGTYGPPATSQGQVDSNGKPIQLDSNGNPIQLDASGHPIKPTNLANTGYEKGYWLTFGAALIIVGAYLYRRSLRLMQ